MTATRSRHSRGVPEMCHIFSRLSFFFFPPSSFSSSFLYNAHARAHQTASRCARARARVYATVYGERVGRERPDFAPQTKVVTPRARSRGTVSGVGLVCRGRASRVTVAASQEQKAVERAVDLLGGQLARGRARVPALLEQSLACVFPKSPAVESSPGEARKSLVFGTH